MRCAPDDYWSPGYDDFLPSRVAREMYLSAGGIGVPQPAGCYKKYPLVSWDLAAERWTMPRCVHLYAVCESCGWQHFESVLAMPERLAVAEFIIESQHWYSCLAGSSAVKFIRWNEDGTP